MATFHPRRLGTQLACNWVLLGLNCLLTLVVGLVAVVGVGVGADGAAAVENSATAAAVGGSLNSATPLLLLLMLLLMWLMGLRAN